MSYISAALRRRVAEDARHRCGYCQAQALVLGMPFEIEHIIPEALGGTSQEENLWLACPRCNRYKGQRTHAVDPESGESAPLFDPRRQEWERHFFWQTGAVYVVGLTPTGRATINALQMNNPFVVRSRRVWVAWGWHPPGD